MTQEKNNHDAFHVKIENLPFYNSMRHVQEKTRLSDDELLLINSGFKAIPSTCICGQEWSAFDIILNAVKQGRHDWRFFKSALTGETDGFFCRTMKLECCRCGVTTMNIGTLYNYKKSKSAGWDYKDR